MTVDILHQSEATGDSESDDNDSLNEVDDEDNGGESNAAEESVAETSACEESDNGGDAIDDVNVGNDADGDNAFGDSTADVVVEDSVVILVDGDEDLTSTPSHKPQHQTFQGDGNKGRRNNNFQGRGNWRGGNARRGKGKWENNKNFRANKENCNSININCDNSKIDSKSNDSKEATYEKKGNPKENSLFKDGPLKFNSGTPNQKQSNYLYTNSALFRKHNENQSQNNGNKYQEKGGNNQNKSNNNNNNNNNNKKGKGNEEQQPKDYLKLVKSVIDPFWKKRSKTEPVDSFVMKLHYRMSVCLFIIMFTIVQSNWYVKESIKCVSAHATCNGELPFHLKNFCLSFSYVCDITSSSGDSCSRRYLLFYRWIHTSFLVIACLYYIPRFLAKKVMNPRLKKLLYDLASNEARYDDVSCEQVAEKMMKYIDMDRGSRSQYLWLVFCHFVAFVIDFGVIFFFHFMLQNRFIGLMYYSYPYQRNPPFFTDYISQTFPPFANCTVHMEHLINVEREETFGCYLYLMELYDKIFIILWLWLMFLSFVTILSIVVLLLVSFSPFSHLFLWLFTPSPRFGQMKRKVQSMSSLNDLYTLYLLKQHCSESQFIRFVAKLIHNSEDTLDEVLVMEGEQKKKCHFVKNKSFDF